jgi:hypothetical protein
MRALAFRGQGGEEASLQHVEVLDNTEGAHANLAD